MSGYVFWEEVDSTTAVLKRLVAAGCSTNVTVIAASQSAGRGKNQRLWVSGQGSLSYSFVCQPQSRDALQLWTLFYALAAQQAIELQTGVTAGIKWPNDLVYQGRKLAGILLESRWQGSACSCIGGIGINCNQRQFPDDLAHKAASLRMITGMDVDTDALACVLSSTINLLQSGKDGRHLLLDRVRSLCVSLGKRVLVLGMDGSTIEGTATEIIDSGAMRVVLADGSERLCWEGDLQHPDHVL